MTPKRLDPQSIFDDFHTPKITHNAAPITPRYAAPIVLSSVGSARLVSRGAIALRMGKARARGGGGVRDREVTHKQEKRTKDGDPIISTGGVYILSKFIIGVRERRWCPTGSEIALEFSLVDKCHGHGSKFRSTRRATHCSSSCKRVQIE